MDKLEAVAEAFAVGEEAHKRIGVTPAMRELMQTYRDNQIAVAETLSEVEPAIEAARAAGIREGLEMAAKVAYVTCAQTRHVTLGDKVADAIRALKDSHPTPDAV